jgi:two-component system OmpR family sensor kinase
MTLRLKLLVAVIVMVFAGLLVSDVVTYTSLRSFLLNRVDQQLLASREFVARAIVEEQNVPDFFPGGSRLAPALLPPGTYGLLRGVDGRVIGEPVTIGFAGNGQAAPALPSRLPGPGESRGGPALFTTAAAGDSSLRYRVLAQAVQLQPSGERGTLIVAVPLTELSQTLRRLILIEGLVTAVVVIGLGFLSWWLVRRELRPLKDIGTTAGAIAAGDLSQRVPQQDPRTEVGQLGVALNAMLAQIEQAFTERKESEDRLRRFLADASHELRTPLTSIRGYAELFRRGAGRRREDLSKSMRRIEEESARMGVMVEDLLLLARLDQDRPLEREPVDLAALASDAVQDARALAADRDIAVEASGPVVIQGDEARLRQVAANLLTNAVIHTAPGTPVAVRVTADGNRALMEVADRGPGLSPEVAERAFEPFYRFDPSRDRSTGGAGLGLAIVAAIAKAHGGTVEASPTPGGGATFRVWIPRDGADGEPGTP